jgi:hypothetical protein
MPHHGHKNYGNDLLIVCLAKKGSAAAFSLDKWKTGKALRHPLLMSTVNRGEHGRETRARTVDSKT